MKAAILPGKLAPLILEDTPKPVPAPGEALIRLNAAALNRRDLWIQRGQYAALRYPALLGSDGAGIVEEVGSGVEAGWVGKAVIINPSLHWGTRQEAPEKTSGILGMPTAGCLAEYVVVPAENLFEKPAHLSWEEAAALPLAGLTAYRAVFYRGQLKAGQKLLVTGAGGGAAQLALQFGLKADAEVWVTSSSEEKLARCVDSGARGGVLYTQEGWDKALKEKAGAFDLIVDSAGGSEFNKLIELARDGGKIALFGGTAGPWPSLSPQRVFWKQIDILGTTMGSPKDFADMANFVNRTELRPTVGLVFNLDQADEALAAMERGEGIGKIVVRIA